MDEYAESDILGDEDLPEDEILEEEQEEKYL
jgi:hypothetical protein